MRAQAACKAARSKVESSSSRFPDRRDYPRTTTRKAPGTSCQAGLLRCAVIKGLRQPPKRVLKEKKLAVEDAMSRHPVRQLKEALSPGEALPFCLLPALEKLKLQTMNHWRVTS